MAAVFNTLATSRPCENIRCFHQDYQQDKITSQISLLMTEYFVTVFYKLWMV